MPRSAYAATRDQLIDWICERLESGWTLQQVAATPQAPHWDTLMTWQRADADLKARFARARAAGQGVRDQARPADRPGYSRVRAVALIARVRGGARLTDLVNAGRPNRQTLNAWKRLSPQFAERLAAAAHASRALRRWRRGDGPTYDEDTGDAIVIRVRRGETLRQVCRDPALPAFTVIKRWRRRHPEFDSSLRFHKAGAFRAQMAARAGPTPELTLEIACRIADGASLAKVGASPDMPCRHTLARWRRERPDFAAVIDDARDFGAWLRAADRAARLRYAGS